MNYQKVVEIHVPHSGSGGTGYLIQNDLILTAYHVVAYADEILASKSEALYDIRFIGELEAGETAWRNAGASLQWYDSKHDLALLRLRGSRPSFLAENELDIQFGKLGGETFSAIGVGFPKVQKIEKRQNPEPVEGRLSRIAGLKEKQLRLQVTSLIPATEEDWAGISGTALFVGKYLVGVITETRKSFGEKALWATPISLVSEDEEFCQLILNTSGLGVDFCNFILPMTGDKEPQVKINWNTVCRRLINSQMQLTTNSVTRTYGMEFSVNDVWIPLGLVQRKKRNYYSGGISAEFGSRLYEPSDTDEVTRIYQSDQFFDEVLAKDNALSNQGRRFAIIGEPGSGKTTVLQKIGKWIAEKPDENIAIWIELGNLGEKSLSDYLMENWLTEALNISNATDSDQRSLIDLFNSGRVWLLLDSAEEIATSLSNPLRRLKSDLSGWVANAHVVITCRLNIWDASKNVLNGFYNYRILGFNYGDNQSTDQISQFIGKWFRENSRLSAQLSEILNQEQNSRIKDLVRNPLRLALLCRSWQSRQGKLPNTKAKLYQRFVEDFYIWKEGEFVSQSEISSVQVDELNLKLGQLAMLGLRNEICQFRLTQNLVFRVFGGKDNVLFQLALKLGWLNQVGVASEDPDELVYAFFHSTFQEYFASTVINDWGIFFPREPGDSPRMDITDRENYHPYLVFNPSWKEVILLWLGQDNVENSEKELFLEKLLNFRDGCGDFYGYQACFLAAAGIKEFKDSNLSDRIIREMIRWSFGYFNDQSNSWRLFLAPIAKGARAVLLETDLQRAIAILQDSLQKIKREPTQEQALSRLREIGSGYQQAIRLLNDLLNTSEKAIRWKVAEALWEINPGNQQAIDAFSNLLEARRVNRAGGGFELTKIPDIGALQVVSVLEKLKKLSKDEGISIAISDAQDIYRYRQVERDYDPPMKKDTSLSNVEIDDLIDTVQTSNDEIEIIRAIEDFTRIDFNSNLDRIVLALLELAQKDSDEQIRSKIAEALGQLNIKESRYPKVVNLLVDLLENDPDDFTRARAAESLGKISLDGSEHRVITVLLEALKSNWNDLIRKNVAKSLGKIDYKECQKDIINGVVSILKITNSKAVCLNIVEILGKLGVDDEDSINALINLLFNTKHDEVSNAVIQCMKIVLTDKERRIRLLSEILHQSHDNTKSYYIVETLKAELIDSLTEVQVSALSTHMQDPIDGFQSYHYCFDVLWDCAYKTSYPSFYQAWHHPTPVESLPEIEVIEPEAISYEQNPVVPLQKNSPRSGGMYRIRMISESEGLDTIFECDNETYILDAAEEAGIDLPYSCRAGACSICAAKLIRGAVNQDDQSFLDDDQISEGYALICVSYPESNCTFTTHQEENLY